MIVDSHCHLDFPVLAADRLGVLTRARAAGVECMVNVATKKSTFSHILQTAESEEDIFCSFGIHPHEAANEDEAITEQEIVAAVQHKKVVGIGETGLDYFYDKSPRDKQKEVFRCHIRAAQKTGLPIIIHSRDAEADTVDILKEEGGAAGVLHCFSSGRLLAEQGVAQGLYVSISGIITFKKSEELRDIVRDIPLDRILVETDAPYLSPEPLRGKPCEPAFVVHTAQMVAEIKGIGYERLAEATTQNFYRLFQRASRTK